MRMCKELSSDSTMEEITAELSKLNAALYKIEGDYLAAAKLDPDYKQLSLYKTKAIYYMRTKVYTQ